MTIKNAGTKIVNIGTEVLLPDATIDLKKEIVKAPSIKALIKKGVLVVVDEGKNRKDAAKAKAEAEAKAAAEAAAKEKAAAGTPPEQ